MKKYTIYLFVLLGAVLGFLGAAESFLAMLFVIAAMCFIIMVMSDYEKATYVVAAYSIIDFLLRTFAGGFAGIWDEAYLAVLILLWIYKLFINQKEDGIKLAPLDFPAAFFITAMFFILIVNTSDISIGIEGFRASVQYILWYFITVQLLRTEKGAKNLLIAFSLISGFIAMHGIYQYVIGAEMPTGWVDSKEAGVRTRVYSILGSPNVMGSLMTLSAPICFALGLNQRKKGKCALFIFLSLCMVISLLFTFSRGAWIGFAAAAVLYVFLKDKRWFIPAIIAGVLAILIVPGVGSRLSYMLSSEYIESSMKGGRLIRWTRGLTILKDNLLLGVGHGQFGGAVAMNHGIKRLIETEVIKTFYMDNYYLKTAVETGIVGLGAFLTLILSVFTSFLRTIRVTADKGLKEIEIGILCGAAGVIVHNFVENIFEVPMMATCFWLLAAVMMHFWRLNFVKKGIV